MIYFLDDDAELSAQAHVDVHLSAMVTDAAKVVGDALQMLGMKAECFYPYPSEVDSALLYWTAHSQGNFLRALRILIELIREHDHRRGAVKRDGSTKFTRARQVASAGVDLAPYVPHGPTTPPPLLMPPDFYRAEVVQAYREYYQWRTARMGARWTKRTPPKWWNQKGD